MRAEFQICTALVFIGIEPAPAQDGGSSTRFATMADHEARLRSGVTDVGQGAQVRARIPRHCLGSGLVVLRHFVGDEATALVRWGGSASH